MKIIVPQAMTGTSPEADGSFLCTLSRFGNGRIIEPTIYQINRADPIEPEYRPFPPQGLARPQRERSDKFSSTQPPAGLPLN